MRVVIANRNAAVAEGLALLLEKHGEFDVVSVSEIPEVVSAVLDSMADMLLVDPELPELDLKGLIDQVAEAASSTAVAVLTGSNDPRYLRVAVESGARGYVSMDAEPEELVRKLELIGEGHVLVSGPIAKDLSDLMGGASSNEDLSEREIEVVNLVARGSTNKEIARSLVITENTVKVLLRNIYGKLDIRNRQQLVAHALRSGIAEEPVGS